MKNPLTPVANTHFNAEPIDNSRTNSSDSRTSPSRSCLPTLTELLYDYKKSNYEKSNYEKSDHEKNAPVSLQKAHAKQSAQRKDVDISQQQLIEQFKKHIAAKNRMPDPSLEERGYCLGLSSVWLARMAQNEGAQFESELTLIATLTAKEIETLPDQINTPIERLFNLLQWAQQSGKLLKIPQVNPLEKDPSFISTLCLTLTGTPTWCAHLLYAPECHELDSVPLTPKNTLILLRFFGHATALYRNEVGLWFYDPNCKNGAELMVSRQALSEALWKANGGGEHLTFSLDLYNTNLQQDHCHKYQRKYLFAPDHLATLMAEEMDFSGFIHSSDVNGCTALLNAAKQGHSQAVKAFLNFGVDANQASHQGVTPLLIAAIKNHVEIVKDLIAHGADINKADHDGDTPLWMAAQNGHIEIVQMLMNAGAAPSPHKPNHKE